MKEKRIKNAAVYHFFELTVSPFQTTVARKKIDEVTKNRNEREKIKP